MRRCIHVYACTVSSLTPCHTSEKQQSCPTQLQLRYYKMNDHDYVALHVKTVSASGSDFLAVRSKTGYGSGVGQQRARPHIPTAHTCSWGRPLLPLQHTPDHVTASVAVAALPARDGLRVRPAGGWLPSVTYPTDRYAHAFNSCTEQMQNPRRVCSSVQTGRENPKGG